MTASELPQLGPSADHYELGRGLVDAGRPFPEIRQRLVSAGLRAGLCDSLIVELGSEYVEPLVIAGVSVQKIQSRLADRGLSPTEIANVLEAARRKHGRRLGKAGLGSGKRYTIACAVLLAGVAVAIGNESGLLPTIPGLGSLMIVVALIIGSVWSFRS